MSKGWPGRAASAARRRLGAGVSAAWLAGGVAVLLGGCGPGLYLASMRPAERAVARAHDVGAEELATYDYYFALAHLDKAREEAAESSFQDAADHARVAREHAERAEATSRGATTAP